MIIVGFLIWTIIALYVHELGHYFIAKKEKIYEGWGIIPTPHIKIKEPFSKRIYYLSGLFASILTLPVWIISNGDSIESLIMFVVFINLIAGADWVLFFAYNSVVPNK